MKILNTATALYLRNVELGHELFERGLVVAVRTKNRIEDALSAPGQLKTARTACASAATTIEQLERANHALNDRHGEDEASIRLLTKDAIRMEEKHGQVVQELNNLTLALQARVGESRLDAAKRLQQESLEKLPALDKLLRAIERLDDHPQITIRFVSDGKIDFGIWVFNAWYNAQGYDVVRCARNALQKVISEAPGVRTNLEEKLADARATLEKTP